MDASHVLYLTSDAGEGKTSLINHVAIEQAKLYKAKKTKWLLVPVELGGRTFLRFDDVVISALVNKLRFRRLYYDAFLELVRLGVVVPAFDGFEEMIVDSGPSEAISALGNLLERLHSEGRILVSARKAYFEYLSFRSQGRLFDTLGPDTRATFARCSLNRWDRKTFEYYAAKRQVAEPGKLFREASMRLKNPLHPVLTRAVLVKRLIDVAVKPDGISTLLDRIGNSEEDYFFEFVEGIVDREATEKWVDRSGASSRALLTTAEHNILLSMVAEEMWLSGVEELREDVIAIIVEMFVDTCSEEKRRNPDFTRQILERIKQHSLLVRTGSLRPSLKFDHEDFRLFYVGHALGRALYERDIGAMNLIMDQSSLPSAAVREAVRYVRNAAGSHIHQKVDLLQELAGGLLPTSFILANCSILILGLLDGQSRTARIRNMNFPVDALCGRRLSNLTVEDSYFDASKLESAFLRKCKFVNCHFYRLSISGSEKVKDTVIDDQSRVDSIELLKHSDGGQGHWIPRFEPRLIRRELERSGFNLPPAASKSDDELQEEIDDDLELVQRFLRAFLRSTFLSEQIILKRLGTKAHHFLKNLQPRLLSAGVIGEFAGHKSQDTIRLVVQMDRIEDAIRRAGGNFEKFLDEIQRETA